MYASQLGNGIPEIALSSFNSPIGHVKSSMASVCGAEVVLVLVEESDDDDEVLDVDCKVELVDATELDEEKREEDVDEVLCVIEELCPADSANAPATATTMIMITIIKAETVREIESRFLRFPEKLSKE